MSSQDSRTSGFYSFTEPLKGVYYGPGCLKVALPKLLTTLQVHKALVVTGRTLHSKTDIVAKVEAVLREHNAFGNTFSEIGEHAPIAGIKSGVKALNDCEADFIVSIGGGSPIDASKTMIYRLQKDNGGAFLKHIAIPTTISAAEYTAVVGFTDENGDKQGLYQKELAPSGIILDAELTLATPEKLWLSTGIRALDHAVETLYRPHIPHPVKLLCYAALADLFRYLPQAKAEPQNVEVRQKLQVAAWMSMWPLVQEKPSPFGLSHALGYALGAKYGISHGITSCLTLAPTVALKAEIASAEDKRYLAEALFYLRVPSTGSVEGDILKLSSEIDRLVADLGLKTNLAAAGVPRTDLESIAKRALGSSDDPVFSGVVRLLEGLYPGRRL